MRSLGQFKLGEQTRFAESLLQREGKT